MKTRTLMESATVRLNVSQLNDSQLTQMAVNELTRQLMRQVNAAVVENNYDLGSVSISSLSRHYEGEVVDMSLSAAAVVFFDGEKVDDPVDSSVPTGREPTRTSHDVAVHNIQAGQEKESRQEAVFFGKEESVAQRLEKIASQYGFVIEKPVEEGTTTTGEAGKGELLPGGEPRVATLDLSAIR